MGIVEKWATESGLSEEDIKLYLAYCAGDEELMGKAILLAQNGVSRETLLTWIAVSDTLAKLESGTLVS